MGLLDLFRRKSQPDKAVGLHGYTIHDGLLIEREKSAALSGTQKYKTYSDLIQNTSAVAAGVRSYLDFVGHPNWRVTPANSSAEAHRYAEIVEKAIHSCNRSWRRVVKRSATHVLYGFDIQEVTMDKDDEGNTIVSKIHPRPQHTIELWDVSESGEVAGVLQTAPDGERSYLPMWKCAYVSDDSITDSPEGLGLLRQVTSASKRLARLEQLEAFGYETDLRGIPVGRAPLSALADQVAKGKLKQAEADKIVAPLKDFLENHVKTASLALLMDSMVYKSTGTAQMPSQIYRESIELLQGDGVGLAEVSAAILRLNHEIARVLGVEHILLGQDRGTQSLSADKTDTFRMRIEGILTELCWVYQQKIVVPMAVANGWPVDLTPMLKHDPIRQSSVDDLAKVLESIARAGAPLDPDDDVIDAIRDIMRLPRTPEISLRDQDAALTGTTPPAGPGEANNPADQQGRDNAAGGDE